MHNSVYLAATAIALVAFVHGIKFILRARTDLKYWDKFSKDGILVKFVSKRGLNKSTFRRERKKEPYRLLCFGIACVGFSVCVILVALGTLFL